MSSNKKWYQSKTLWFSILWAIVQLAGIWGFADYSPSGDVTYYVNLLVSAVVGILRLVTKKGIEL